MLTAPFVAVTLIVAAYAHAQPQPPAAPAPPSLLVTGQATVDAPADQVEIVISVVTEAENSKEAADDNNRKAARVLEAIRRAGLDAKEATTGSFQVQPKIVYPDPRSGGDTTPRITGYRVENSIRVKTRKLAILGAVVQSAIDAGANRIESMNFSLADEKSVRLSALREAVQSARAEANAVAAASGVTIVGIRRLSIDQDFSQPRFARTAMLQGAGAESAPPLVAGDVSVTARVSIEFDIADKSNEKQQ